ncbi:MAG: YceI family protein [Bacteroidota bacterium]
MYKNLKIAVVAVVTLSFTAFVWTDMANWNIQKDYEVRFEGRGAEGTFSGLEGEVVFDPSNLSASKMDVSVDASSISTGNATKDKHARGESWFHTEKYPKIQFQSKRFSKQGSTYEVVGDLNLRGVKKEITIPFTFKEQAKGGLFEGNFVINRTDYGIEGPFISFTVAKELEVSLSVPVAQ